MNRRPTRKEVQPMVLALEREPRQRRLWGQIVARAWDDDCFRQRLLAESEAVLREAGIDVPGSIPVRVVEDGVVGDDGVCLQLPPRPSGDDLTEDDLSVPGTANGPYGHCPKTKPCSSCGVCCV